MANVAKTEGLSVVCYVDNVEKTLNFWQEAFGAKIDKGMTMKTPEGETLHGGVRFGDTWVMFGPTNMPPPDQDERAWKAWMAKPRYNAIQLYVNVKNVKKAYEKAKAYGAEIEQELRDEFWGDRTFIAQDNNGIVVGFAQTVKKVTPAQMKKMMKEFAEQA
ncbi:MAG TPA: VOC family protein [Candidatus Thermoplasmatota archaeon]|nr:VOC family protein [Candidatus Thermoplasmatota archaeon]